MKVYLYTMFAVFVFDILLYAGMLAYERFPRARKPLTVESVVLTLLCRVALSIWVGALIWGGS